MKHYPTKTLFGESASCCIDVRWKTITVSVKFPHRKGQLVDVEYIESNLVDNIWIDEYPTFTAVRFETKQQYFNSPKHACQYCTDLVTSVTRYVNFDSKDDLVSKDLLIILGKLL